MYAGISSVAAFTLGTVNPVESPNLAAFGSFLQIGFAFALGIAFAIIVRYKLSVSPATVLWFLREV